MKAYISISYKNRRSLEKEVQAISEVLNKHDIEPFVFVDNYTFDTNQEQQMMKQAIKDIEGSDFLIAETSDKGIGIGIEVGYAKAQKKKVVYIRQKNAEHSTTVSGISDYHIFYDNSADLNAQLEVIICNVINTLSSQT